MWKYVENIMKKYVTLGIRRAKRGASRHIYLSPYIKALELEIMPSSPHISSGTWRNSELHALYRLWGLKELVRVIVYSFLPIKGHWDLEAWRQDSKDMKRDLI